MRDKPMIAADLNTDKARTAALVVPNDDDTALLWPNLKAHQTPAERVVEAAREYQRRPGVQTEAALFDALSVLNGGRHG